jgi:hypothetical protein
LHDFIGQSHLFNGIFSAFLEGLYVNQLLFQFLCHASITPQPITNILVYMNNQVNRVFSAVMKGLVKEVTFNLGVKCGLIFTLTFFGLSPATKRTRHGLACIRLLAGFNYLFNAQAAHGVLFLSSERMTATASNSTEGAPAIVVC